MNRLWNFFLNPSTGTNFFYWKTLIFVVLWIKKITSTLDMTIQCFDCDESCQKCHFKQHSYSWSTFKDASFYPQESPKFPRFEKLKDLTNLTQIFEIWSYSVLIGIKVVGNYILNNLYLHDKLPILYSSPCGSLLSWPNSQIW